MGSLGFEELRDVREVARSIVEVSPDPDVVREIYLDYLPSYDKEYYQEKTEFPAEFNSRC
jgi:hypothetical protein